MASYSSDTHNNSVSMEDALLWQVNTEEAKNLFPVVVYISVLMGLGLMGNSLALYIYKFRFKRSSSRAFILCLAFLDNVTCLVGMPYHIYDMLHPYTYFSALSCKGLTYVLCIILLSSAFVLVIIAVDRYQKICKPFARQISDFGTKKSCLVAIILSSVLSIPNIIIYGNATVGTGIPNVTGVECFIADDYVDSVLTLTYEVILFIIFVGSTMTLLVLYTFVGIKIWKSGAVLGKTPSRKNASGSGHFRICGNSPETTNDILSDTDDSNIKIKAISFKKNSNGENGNDCVMEFENGTSPIVRQSSTNGDKPRNKDQINVKMTLTKVQSASPKMREKSNHRNDKKRESFRGRLRRQTMSVSDEESSDYYDSLRQRQSSARKKLSRFSTAPSLSKRQRRTVRITGMLFLITLVFVISFLPHLILLVLETVDPERFENMSRRENLIYNFLLRTYFVNNMANPIVYGLLDPKFRYEIFALFHSLIHCKCKRLCVGHK